MFRPLTLSACTALCAISALAHAEVELYGQVNKGLYGFSDGNSTEYFVGDNSYSSTRFGFKGSTEVGNGLTASILFENEMTSNPTHSQTQNSTAGHSPTPASNTPALTERQARVGLSHKTLGGLYLGQQSTAIDGVLNTDLAGTYDVMNADYRKIGGGLQFRNSTTNALTSLTINGQVSDIATKRTDSLRYDSPKFGPLQLRTSIAQGGDLELAAVADHKIGDFKLKGGAGVEFNNDATTGSNTTERRYAAYASAAHSSGLAATLAYAANDIDNKTATLTDEPSSWYGKLSYAWGPKSLYEVAADYGQSNHFGSMVVADDQLTTFGLAAQYNVVDGVSLATLYRNFDLERTGTPTEDIDLWGVNMRVKF